MSTPPNDSSSKVNASGGRGLNNAARNAAMTGEKIMTTEDGSPSTPARPTLGASSHPTGKAPEKQEGEPPETDAAKTDGAADSASQGAVAHDPKAGQTASPAGASAKKPVEQGQPNAATLAKAGSRNPSLLSSRYVINVYLWKIADGTQEAMGSILSQSLQKVLLNQAPEKYAGDILLGQIRRLAAGMSSFARIHQFCTSDGVLVFDEQITLEEYLALDSQDAPGSEESQAPEPELAAKPTLPGKATAVPRLSLFYRSTSTSDDVAKAAAAPKAETQPLNMNMSENRGAADLAKLAAPANPESMIDKDGTLGPSTTGNPYSVTAGSLSEKEWAVILRNCAVFFGWKVDTKSQRITRAPRAAFQLRTSGAAQSVDVAAFETIKTMADANESELGDSAVDLEDSAAQDQAKITADAKVASLHGFQTTLNGIPNFRTNDDSRIEITACATALAESLAKSDFSSQATEASVSGGFAGITAGVSSGYASSQSQEHKVEKSTSTQTLVARYMFPRCDLFLRAEDLEPTPEFAELLYRVRLQKSLDALRQIQAQYGQLFCQELTLGARLLSTKTITATEDASVDSQKEQFKVSVGVSVQTPYGGASVKHEQEKGSAESRSTTTTTSKESNVFEACGGDTILASNPIAWASSVATPSLWRVVNRDGLSTLVDMLSAMPGYEASQMWFVQAIPALSKYIRLNAAFATNVRFKIESPTNSLSCKNDGTVTYYLGCDQSTTVTPRLMGMSASTEFNAGAFWARISTQSSQVLFNPSTFRAPVIHGFSGYVVGDGPFGSQYNSAFTSSQWEMISPFGSEMPGGGPNELKNYARVILRTVPFRDPTREVKPGDTDPTPPCCHMIAFRNAQGVFLPGISDNDEYQYWRIEKVDSDMPGEPIKGGDNVRLSWRFEDQSTGFRDYKDDVFGRRRNQCPPELEAATLYLKVPWPRFEVEGTPTAMVLSAQASTDVVSEPMATLTGTKPYALQDLKFRIDTVENKSVGDSADYMLRGLVQGRDEVKQMVAMGFGPRAAGNPMQVWSQIAYFGI